MDITLASTLLLVLLPVLLVLVLLVGASSPGPVLFRQQRVGKDGRRFWMYKFRTMADGCDDAVHAAFYRALVRGEAAPIEGAFKLRNDARVTPVGGFLRRFSLDELPQLINIIQGDMALVGPRPPIPYETELYDEREWRRLSARPGLTGLWQVSGRSALNFREMVDLDLEYIDRWSLTLDVLILLQTPLVVLSGDGAY